MTTSPRAGFSFLEESQAQKTTTINEALALLEALTVGGALSRNANTPPTTPDEGDLYILGLAPTGDWEGKSRKLAHFINGSWRFYTPKTGWHIFVVPETSFYYWTGGSWAII